MRRLLSSSLSLLFVLLFLLAQAGAAAHAFSHADEDEGEAGAESCMLCLAMAALDAAAPLPVLPDFRLLAAWLVVGVFFPAACVVSPCRAYWGRAPPRRVACG
jgi:hypothetical protein